MCIPCRSRKILQALLCGMATILPTKNAEIAKSKTTKRGFTAYNESCILVYLLPTCRDYKVKDYKKRILLPLLISTTLWSGDSTLDKLSTKNSQPAYSSLDSSRKSTKSYFFKIAARAKNTPRRKLEESTHTMAASQKSRENGGEGSSQPQ